MRKCVICKTKFEPKFNDLQRTCDIPCAITDATQQLVKKQKADAKADRRKNKEAKDRLKTKSDWLKEAQAQFNRYIRARDYNQPCISCGSYPDQRYGGCYDCGHYRSVGSAPELRFEPLNAHKQCKKCNRQLSGNIVKYRISLVKKIGIKSLDWLEGPHKAKKYTVDQIKQIKAKYAKMARDLEKTHRIPLE